MANTVSFGTSLKNLGESTDGSYHNYAIQIATVVTEDSGAVDVWINDLKPTLQSDATKYNLVGEDRIVTLQLCVSDRCLIFRISKADKIPDSLKAFFSDQGNAFVGFKIKSKLEALQKQFCFGGDAAVCSCGGNSAMVQKVYGEQVVKPRAYGNWDSARLKQDQDHIQNACVSVLGNRRQTCTC